MERVKKNILEDALSIIRGEGSTRTMHKSSKDKLHKKKVDKYVNNFIEHAKKEKDLYDAQKARKEYLTRDFEKRQAQRRSEFQSEYDKIRKFINDNHSQGLQKEVHERLNKEQKNLKQLLLDAYK